MEDGSELMIDIWDTAGQEVFDNIHPTYYFEANAALLVFDTTRKLTYKNCMKWYNEFRNHCPSTPCIVVGNKIDMNKKCVERKYALPEKIGCPFYLTSAADGTNVVRIFEELVKLGLQHKNGPKTDYYDKILDLLDDDDLFDK
jgi:Rab-like protein 2